MSSWHLGWLMLSVAIGLLTYAESDKEDRSRRIALAVGATATTYGGGLLVSAAF